YYRQGGQAFGPVPTGRLKELLAAGRLQPRQAVWRRNSHGLLLVHAATAAFGTTAPRARRRRPSRDRFERSGVGGFPSAPAADDGAAAPARLAVTDTSGMLPNWLSEAVGDRHDPKGIAQAIHGAGAWLDLIGGAVREAERVMQDRRAMPGHGVGYPSY